MQIQQTVSEVAALVGGRVEGAAGLVLERFCTIERAGPRDLAAVFRDGYARQLPESAVGCLLVSEGLELPPGRAPQALIRVADPDEAVDRLARGLAPSVPLPEPGVHPTAEVEACAEVDATASVGPWAFVGAGARIGARTRLGPGAVVCAGARVGSDCVLRARVVIEHHCELGDRVVIHAGAVIGADGFGYRADDQGRPVKVPQVGTVLIGDDVEIGANATIDRARFDATTIGDGCKIDDQVHVGHNVTMGRYCIVAAQCALAGRARLEDGVVLGGSTGVVGDAVLGAGSQVGGHSFVTGSTAPGEVVIGSPARPRRAWAREVLSLKRLPALLARSRGRPPVSEDHGA